ncbi:MAG: TetR/AcrR family transcriptional regulator [Corynebacteriales bacterium]|nr:TetR/AcrR family transcriptional regulator [Mycobacteriales bacterium]
MPHTATKVGRPRQFDEAAVLGAAMEQFWAHGFHATSLTDLTTVTGLHKGSLYGAFGDKHALLLATLRHYSKVRRAKVDDDLASHESPLESIGVYLKRMAREASAQSHGRGCFISNTALEMLPGDPQVAAIVTEHRHAIQNALAGTLDRARAIGELKNTHSSSELARFIYTVSAGMWERGRSSSDEEQLLNTAELALSTL